MKVFKNSIFTFVLGLIIAGAIGVIAISVSADDISYGNGTVKDAIDDLYTEVGNTLSTEVNSFSFTSSTQVQSFNIGFRPKYIACSIDNVNNNFVAIVYNSEVDNTIITRNNGTTSPVSTFYTISDNGFSWNITDSNIWSGKTVYCTAVK